MKDFDVTLFFFNPNIHPAKEYLDRMKSVKNLAEEYHLPIFFGEYLYQDFLEQLFLNNIAETPKRCKFCYELRMEETATLADQSGISLFCTTLLYSIYQDHELIVQSAQREAEKKNGIKFFYKDFRLFFEEGKLIARDKGYYMQKYCGCIFSNEERYKKQLNEKKQQ